MPPDRRRPPRPFVVAIAIAAMTLSLVVMLDPGVPPRVSRSLDVALLGLLALMLGISAYGRRR